MPLSWNEIKDRAMAFSKTWATAKDEDSEAKPFWIDFFEVFGVKDKRVATFELAVKKYGGANGFVDLFWPGQLLVEHKSKGKSLDKAFAQAQDYFAGIKDEDLPHTIVVCDFATFRVHTLTTGEVVEFPLAELHKNVQHFAFIAGYKVQVIQPQNPVNIKAAERMGRLHDLLKDSGFEGHDLELLLVRLLFCLFADDTGIFETPGSFQALIEERSAEDGSDLGPLLGKFFQTLNTRKEKRQKSLDEQVGAFPYVNGKLFAEPAPMAEFNADMRAALIQACKLDWSAISPAVFGALFQSIMDKDARRNLGAHYTGEENILKVIGPLFMDDLKAEFEKVKANKNKLWEFRKKLRMLHFFDPACGCGNFLVVAYRELRLLELAVLQASRKSGQTFLNVQELLGIDVDQFYGIEIDEFPAQIARVALWLMDHQMNLRVGQEFGQYFARIPLDATATIHHGNALEVDWADVLDPELCTYILGNPPFVGAKMMDDAQRASSQLAFGNVASAGLLDFVAAWYVKATRYIRLRQERAPDLQPIRVGFVSTNSITQGEQVGVLWGWMLSQGIHIHFAHRTFSWRNEAKGIAAVHCVIIGFGLENPTGKVIYDYEDIKGKAHAVPAANINPYLVDGPDVLAVARAVPLGAVNAVQNGSIPADGGHLLLEPGEVDAFVAGEPLAAKFIRRYLGAAGFINGTDRFCLWLKDCSPAELKSMPSVLERVKGVQVMRLASDKAATRAKAMLPTLFTEDRQPSTDYLAIPRTSSEHRPYLPLGYLSASVIAANDLQVVPGATLYEFGVLSSRMHRAWANTTSGRLKSDLRYSVVLTYNTFPWPEVGSATDEVAKRVTSAVSEAGAAVLAARGLFQDSSLADLYDPLTMPPALLKAHQKLDAAVDAAYVLNGGKKSWKSDAERVAFLFELYQKYTSLFVAEKPGKGKGKAAQKKGAA